MEEIDPDLLHQFEVINAGSVEKITAAVEAMPITREWLTIVGVYDGDQRSKHASKQARGIQWPALFLPGETSPSEIIRQMLDETPDIRPKLAAELGKTEESIRVALNGVAGTDHHDLVREFSHALSSEVAIVRRGLVRVWLREGQNTRQAKEFVQQLRTTVDSILRVWAAGMDGKIRLSPRKQSQLSVPCWHAAVRLQQLQFFAHSYFCLLLLRRGAGGFFLVRRAERAFALGDWQ
jgi:hypothetical protein